VAVEQFSALREGHEPSGLPRRAVLTGRRLARDSHVDPVDHDVDIEEAGGHDAEALREASLARLWEAAP